MLKRDIIIKIGNKGLIKVSNSFYKNICYILYYDKRLEYFFDLMNGLHLLIIIQIIFCSIKNNI